MFIKADVNDKVLPCQRLIMSIIDNYGLNTEEILLLINQLNGFAQLSALEETRRLMQATITRHCQRPPMIVDEEAESGR